MCNDLGNGTLIASICLLFLFVNVWACVRTYARVCVYSISSDWFSSLLLFHFCTVHLFWRSDCYWIRVLWVFGPMWWDRILRRWIIAQMYWWIRFHPQQIMFNKGWQAHLFPNIYFFDGSEVSQLTQRKWKRFRVNERDLREYCNLVFGINTNVPKLHVYL